LVIYLTLDKLLIICYNRIMIKKIKDENIIDGYKVGNLKMVVQAIPDSVTGRLIKGVFCTLNVMTEKDEKCKHIWVQREITRAEPIPIFDCSKCNSRKEQINFTFVLNSVPTFRKAVLSMINEAISLKGKDSKIKK